MKLQLTTEYSQRASYWIDKLLGYNSVLPYTIGNYGCLLTTLANYLNCVGYKETPNTLNETLKTDGGFVNGGFLVWGVFEKAYDLNLHYQSPQYNNPLTDDTLNEMKALIDSGHYLVTEIDFDPIKTGKQMHWVGVYGYDKDDFYCLDPWTGKKVPLDTYGDIREAIYSFKCYSKKLDVVSDSPNCEDMIKKLERSVETQKDRGDEWKKKCRQERDDHDITKKKLKTCKILCEKQEIIIGEKEVELKEVRQLRKDLKTSQDEVERLIIDIKRLNNLNFTIKESVSHLLTAISKKLKRGGVEDED